MYLRVNRNSEDYIRKINKIVSLIWEISREEHLEKIYDYILLMHTLERNQNHEQKIYNRADR